MDRGQIGFLFEAVSPRLYNYQIQVCYDWINRANNLSVISVEPNNEFFAWQFRKKSHVTDAEAMKEELRLREGKGGLTANTGKRLAPASELDAGTPILFICELNSVYLD